MAIFNVITVCHYKNAHLRKLLILTASLATHGALIKLAQNVKFNKQKVISLYDKNRYNLLVKIVFQVLEIYISIALVNEHSHAPVTLTKLICLRRVFWSVVDV